MNVGRQGKDQQPIVETCYERGGAAGTARPGAPRSASASGRAYPDEYPDGARRAYAGNKLYPRRFAAWPLERRNAWFAGFNVGYCDRKRERAVDAP